MQRGRSAAKEAHSFGPADRPPFRFILNACEAFAVSGWGFGVIFYVRGRLVRWLGMTAPRVMAGEEVRELV